MAFDYLPCCGSELTLNINPQDAEVCFIYGLYINKMNTYIQIIMIVVDRAIK